MHLLLRGLLATPLIVTCLTAPVGAQRPAVGTLSASISDRIRSVPGAEVAVSYRDLATGDSLDIGADVDFHAASTMKIPVMLEVLRAAEAGRLGLDQEILLVNRFHSIVDGSPYSLDAGEDSDSAMYARVGQRVPVRELMERMIVRSSNLATNAVIALVGAARADSTAHALGARNIRVLRGVEDGKAFQKGLNNTTTARDLGTLLEAIEKRSAASPRSCTAMLDILSRQEFNGEIPAGLPPGTRVAHKTGQITGVLHDAALVYLPGKAPYVLVVLTRNIDNDRVARTLIADLSRLVYEHVARAAPVTTR